LLLAHTGADRHIWWTQVNIYNYYGSPDYLHAYYDDNWNQLASANGQNWTTISRPSLTSNSSNLSVIRLSILDDDRNMAYIGGGTDPANIVRWGNWQIEHQRALLVAAPTLYNNTNTGEIDAVAFVNVAPSFHLARLMRCD
jgi:hypothetical protein